METDCEPEQLGIAFIKSVISDLSIFDNHVSKLIMLIYIHRLSKGVSSTAAR